VKNQKMTHDDMATKKTPKILRPRNPDGFYRKSQNLPVAQQFGVPSFETFPTFKSS